MAGRDILTSKARDHTIRLWDAVTGQHKTTLIGHMDGVVSVVFSPDGRTLASGSQDGTARLWDVVTGKHKTTLRGHTDSVYSVAFSPDGRTLASGSRDNTIRLWDAVTGKHKSTLRGHMDRVCSVAFSPDGRTLASGSYDNTIRLWDATGKHRTTLRGHTDFIFSVAFSPDGRTLASGSQDGTIRLWDAVTGKHKSTLRGHKDFIFSVAFSPNGRTLASGSYDGTMILWDLTSTTDASLTTSPSPVQSPAIEQKQEPQQLVQSPAIEQKQEPQRSTTSQNRMRPLYATARGSNALSIGGVSVGFHTELGTKAPFIGVFGYHREPVTFTYTGQPQTIHLGWLGGVEYSDASWGDSYLGINTKVDAEIFLVSGMIGTDIQYPSGVFTAGAGLAFYTMNLGVGVSLFGIETSGSDEYSGFTPTALIAYTYHTMTYSKSELAATFYARYQGQGFMVGVSLGIISFD